MIVLVIKLFYSVLRWMEMIYETFEQLEKLVKQVLMFVVSCLLLFYIIKVELYFFGMERWCDNSSERHDDHTWHTKLSQPNKAQQA